MSRQRRTPSSHKDGRRDGAALPSPHARGAYYKLLLPARRQKDGLGLGLADWDFFGALKPAFLAAQLAVALVISFRPAQVKVWRACTLAGRK
jgi:hypothetical protein